MQTTPYRFHQFHKPGHAPFESGPHQWTTIVAEFVVPLVKEEKGLIYWFCDEGDHFQLCFASADFKSIEEKIEARRKLMGIVSKSSPADGATVAAAFGGERWIPKDKIGDQAFESGRSELMLRLLHATCQLFISALVQDGSHWKLESNSSSQNPLGSFFESVLHMVSNISKAEFQVHFGYSTSWMPLQSVWSARCHL